MIGAMEGWYLATADIPGEFLQTNYNKGDIQSNMEGEMVTLLNDINPAFYKDCMYIFSLIKKFIYAED